MKEKPKRAGPLSIPYGFDDAINRVIKVKPPLGGWAEYGKAKKQGRKQRRSKSPT